MKNLREIFNIKKGDVVSIVGSGGKSTLMFKLAEELKNEYKVLVSTSARIIMPSKEQYDFLFTDLSSYLKEKKLNKNGIYVISKSLNTIANKMIGIDDEDLDFIINDFDIVLLEADGSRNMPIKGWKNHEPPILNKANKTIGVFPANFINEKKDKNFIYGFDEFNILTDNCEYINFEAIGKICSNKNGIFKNSKGELYLFLNKAETKEKNYISKELSKYLKNNIVKNPFNFKICIGSLTKGVYYEC